MNFIYHFMIGNGIKTERLHREHFRNSRMSLTKCFLPVPLIVQKRIFSTALPHKYHGVSVTNDRRTLT